MNTFWKHYGRVAALMVGIVLLSVAVTVFTGTVGISHRDKTVVTTTYPLYVAVQNVVDGTNTVTVENLTGSASGCLHDYQLSPANRITLERYARGVARFAEGGYLGGRYSARELPRPRSSAQRRIRRWARPRGQRASVGERYPLCRAGIGGGGCAVYD